MSPVRLAAGEHPPAPATAPAGPADLHHPAPRTAGTPPASRSFADLAGSSNWVGIEHLGQIYRLQSTRSGKLILTK